MQRKTLRQWAALVGALLVLPWIAVLVYAVVADDRRLQLIWLVTSLAYLALVLLGILIRMLWEVWTGDF